MSLSYVTEPQTPSARGTCTDSRLSFTLQDFWTSCRAWLLRESSRLCGVARTRQSGAGSLPGAGALVGARMQQTRMRAWVWVWCGRVRWFRRPVECPLTGLVRLAPLYPLPTRYPLLVCWFAGHSNRPYLLAAAAAAAACVCVLRAQCTQLTYSSAELAAPTRTLHLLPPFLILLPPQPA